MDQFEEVKLTDKIKDSLSKLLNRDLTSVTFSAGTSFPSDLTSDMVGRICHRTDLHALYVLTSYSPVVWTIALDYSTTPAKASTVAANYQPLNSKLTMLSNVESGANKLPYFLSSTEMSTITLSTIGKSIMSAADASSIRTLLGLGSLATKSTVGTNDISDGSITTSKLAFTPITAADINQTGDIKEIYGSSAQSGWIDMTGTIGSAQSGATYANANAQDLFLLLWSKSGIEIQPSKGTTAASDWGANKKLVLPTPYTYNANTTVRIKL